MSATATKEFFTLTVTGFINYKEVYKNATLSLLSPCLVDCKHYDQIEGVELADTEEDKPGDMFITLSLKEVQ